MRSLCPMVMGRGTDDGMGDARTEVGIGSIVLRTNHVLGTRCATKNRLERVSKPNQIDERGKIVMNDVPVPPDWVRNLESGVSQAAKATTAALGGFERLWLPSDVIMGISQTTTVLVARYSAHFCLQRAENSDG